VLSINDVTVLYTPSGGRTAVLTVTRTGPTGPALSVKYATQDGTASSHMRPDGPPQYNTKFGRLDFASGQTSGSIFVSVGPVKSFGNDPADTADFSVILLRPHNGSFSIPDVQGKVTVHNTPESDQHRPTIKPIDTLDHLFHWEAYEGPTWSTSKATVPLQSRAHPGMQVLAEFDMGPWGFDPYFDEWSQGGTGQSADKNRQASNVYNFGEWQYVDAMYYLAKNLLGIPPTVWTNAAHANGVASLGSIFLSYGPPYEKKLNFPDALDSHNFQQFVDSAINIAKSFGFDGYIIDNESANGPGSPGLPTAKQSQDLMTMLKAAGLKVIWYDAPISGGFANYLNNEAIPFMNAAGLYQPNYDWMDPDDGPPSPHASYQTILAHPSDFPNALAARDKVFSSLYPYDYTQDSLGLWKDSAFFQDYTAIIPKSGSGGPPGYYTGLGVYGPDWTIYHGFNDVTVKLRDAMTNQRIDQAFWSGTGQFAVSNHIDATQSLAGTIQHTRTVVTSAPFVTNFNTGQGTFYNFVGKTVANNDWNNLSTQSILPNNRYAYLPAPGSSTTNSTAELRYKDAYIGGSSLQVSADAMPAASFTRYRLYDTDLAASTLSRVTFTVKAGPDWQNTFRLRALVYTAGAQAGAPDKLQSFACDPIATANGWVTLQAMIPTTLAGKVTGVGFSVTNASQAPARLDLKVGQMGLFGPSPSPQKPGLYRFSAGPLLDWSKQYNSTSSYNIYGLLDNTYYVLGTTRGKDYATDGIILNRNLNGFTKYLVQEVTKGGDFTPILGRPVARVPRRAAPADRPSLLT
jgi:endo-beta-N-acetylglucosaminidase D